MHKDYIYSILFLLYLKYFPKLFLSKHRDIKREFKNPPGSGYWLYTNIKQSKFRYRYFYILYMIHDTEA